MWEGHECVGQVAGDSGAVVAEFQGSDQIRDAIHPLSRKEAIQLTCDPGDGPRRMAVPTCTAKAEYQKLGGVLTGRDSAETDHRNPHGVHGFIDQPQRQRLDR
jgi:hypothetical protein